MNRRNTWLITILTLLLSVPLISLGISWFNTDKMRQKEKKNELFLFRLKEITNEIELLTNIKIREFSELINRINPADISSIRKILRKSSSFEQLFISDLKGQIKYPPHNKNELTFTEKETLEWLAGLKSEIVNFYKTPLETDYSDTYKFQKRKQYSSSLNFQKISPQVHKKNIKWFFLFQEEGLNLILTTKNTGLIFGLKVNMRKLQSEIIPLLTRERGWLKTAGIILKDAADREIVRKGHDKTFTEKYYTCTENLSKPLNSWKLRCYVHPDDPVNSGERTRVFFFISALLMILILMTFILRTFSREHKKAVEEALRKVSFANRISHELRTPLTNIRMYAELLEDYVEEDEKGASFLKVVMEETTRLMELVENVLLFGRKERGTLKLNPLRINLKDEIEKALHFLDYQIKNSQSEIIMHIDPEHFLFCDPKAFRQVIENLITNAVKYGEGKLIIASSLINKQIKITFTDNGPGIQNSDREKIFEPFIRLSDKLTENSSGTGLGLSIAKELIVKSKGTITIEDSEKGACFVIILPLQDKGEES